MFIKSVYHLGMNKKSDKQELSTGDIKAKLAEENGFNKDDLDSSCTGM